MILLILAIVILIALLILSDYISDFAETIGCVLGFFSILFVAIYTLACVSSLNDAVVISQNTSTQYINSDKTKEDWEWAVAQCEKANELAIKTKNNANMWFFFPCVDFEEYSFFIVNITEDEITFPESYNLPPLKKSITTN